MASLWWVFFYMVHWTLEVNQERRPRVDLHEGATSIGQRAGVWDTETEREDMGGRGERVRDLIQQRREVIWWMSGHLSEVKAWGPSLCKGLNEAAGLALMGRASLHRFYFYFQGGVNNMQIQTHFPPFFCNTLVLCRFWFSRSPRLPRRLINTRCLQTRHPEGE